ncbi:MAG: iron-containing alcohol dehydrogenase [Clostridia bacterium]|jgi:hypothetical protein|nr:iron-containing alcohol dehydrogenase [Clostridia bacterium]MDD4276203.1 iron-containing alcohol dehydrogenase [Clostridia bacterium]
MIDFEFFDNKNITNITAEEIKNKCDYNSDIPKIIFENNAHFKLCNVLNNLAPYQKVLLLSTKTPYSLYGENVSNIILNSKNILKELIFDVNLQGEYSNAKRVIDCVEENTKVIVVLGGGTVIDIAKFVADKLSIPLVILPTTLSPSSCLDYVLITDGVSEKRNLYKTTLAKYIIVDTKIINNLKDNFIAAGYGQLVCEVIELFNMNYVKIMEQKCSYLFSKIAKECATMLPVINKKISAGADTTNELILECLYACAISKCGSNLPLSDDILTALNLNKTRLLGENMFLSAVFLGKLYKIFFLQKAFEYNNFLDVIEYLKKGGSQIDFENNQLKGNAQNYFEQLQKLEITIFKLVEFKMELKSEAEFLDLVIKKCFKTFKRIYADCGYKVLKSVNEKMLKQALYSVENISNSVTPLIQIKNLGLLQEICG